MGKIALDSYSQSIQREIVMMSHVEEVSPMSISFFSTVNNKLRESFV